MIDGMSQTPESAGSVPAATRPPVEEKPRRVNAVAAWVGIAAGSVFIVAVVFFSGFVIGAHSGGGHHRGGHGDGRGGGQMHGEQGPMLRPGPGFPGGPGGQGPDGSRGPGQQPGPPNAPTPPR